MPVGAKAKICPICVKEKRLKKDSGKVLQKCLNGHGFKGKPVGCKVEGCSHKVFQYYFWSCGHKTPYR